MSAPAFAQQPEGKPAGEKARSAPPALAARLGLLPLESTGVPTFRRAHPTFDGRGVIIGVLDSGIDPSIPGLLTTSTGEAKILDLRDFSGEGRIALTTVAPGSDAATIAGTALTGLDKVRAEAQGGPVWAGSIRERTLGEMPAADLNGDGDDDDALVVLVARVGAGWALFADTDGDGSFANETPIHDYLLERETFGWSTPAHARPLTLAANFSGTAAPELDLYFDTSAHGSHVAGIAAGHDIYGIASFDGVAPGAQVLGLKIANDAQGGLTTTGSMARALAYAIRFAKQKQMPLVLNMSFGVGNAEEGHARIDLLIDSVLAANPDVVFAISAGNDGPGLSTLGFPGSASRALGVGATFPVVFRPDAAGPGARQEPMAAFSSRGGELAKPDISVPGVAYSTVPAWNTGDEIKGGTSMASPHAAGLMALLESAALQEKIPVDAVRMRQALMASSSAVPGAGVLDAGAGRPDVGRALAWLEAKRPFDPVLVSVPGHPGATAAYFRDGLRADTVQSFVLSRAGTGARALRMVADQSWLAAPASISFDGPTATVTIGVRASQLQAPGVYVGTVTLTDTDTLVGPVARLIVTVATPLPAQGTAEPLALTIPVNTPSRVIIPVQQGRPVIIQTRVDGEPNGLTVALHEPDGMPFRGGHAPALAAYDSSAFTIDGHDAVTGDYELVALGGDPGQALASVRVIPSPVVVTGATTRPGGVALAFKSAAVEAAPVRAALALLGGATTRLVTGHGGAEVHLPLAVPAWAAKVVVEAAGERAQWNRFTDLGLTLFDADGRQLGKEPLNYPFARLEVELPATHGPMATDLVLFPGLADSTGADWSLSLAVRYIAAAPVSLTHVGPSTAITVGPAASASANFAMPRTSWVLPADWRPWLRASITSQRNRVFTTELPLEGAMPAAVTRAAAPRRPS